LKNSEDKALKDILFIIKNLINLFLNSILLTSKFLGLLAIRNNCVSCEKKLDIVPWLLVDKSILLPIIY
jgi:hypothetical protein